MKKILVPTDFSKQAGHATDMAARLARQHGATIHLVHSVDVPATWQEGHFTSAILAKKPPREQQALYPEARAAVGKARHQMDLLVRELEKNKITVSHEIAPNAAWQDIMRLADKAKCDLIVMGTHGAGALKEAFIGSNTQRVVRMASQPVLTLHDAAPAKIANVAVLTNPLDNGLAKTLNALLAPLAGMKVKYHLVYVNTPGLFQDTDNALEQLRTLAKKLEPEFKLHVCDHYTVAEGAVAFARREGMDLIAMPTHGRKGLKGMLNASIAETVANHSPVPVLTMRVY
jgi:nucleotide-binding universal stress UspA family protein